MYDKIVEPTLCANYKDSKYMYMVEDGGVWHSYNNFSAGGLLLYIWDVSSLSVWIWGKSWG